jgi:hypothetical protein
METEVRELEIFSPGCVAAGAAAFLLFVAAGF